MGCGCSGKRAKRQAAKEQAEQELQAMSTEEERVLVPLGLKESVRLNGGVRVNDVDGQGKTLIITEEDDRRIFKNAAVVRGRNALVPTRLKQNLLARYPGLFTTEEETLAAEPEPA